MKKSGNDLLEEGEARQRPINVLHVPCNTPYVKKLHREKDLSIANGSQSIPLEITYEWILDHQNEDSFWGSFDICHLHYGFEFEKLELIKKVFQLIQEQRKSLVYTCHELSSVHGMTNNYSEYLHFILEHSSEVITLTEAAKKALIKTDPAMENATVIPHGFVSLPDTNKNIISNNPNATPEILLFGALRSNRDTATTLINLLLGTKKSDCRITLATRPFTNRQLNDSPILRTALEMMCRDSRAQVELTLPLTDDEVASRVKQADIMILPYSSAGHSGQLELAFDSGVLPVTTNVGFLDSQRKFWPKNDGSIASGAVVADWSDGKDWLYQTRMLKAVHESLDILPEFKKTIVPDERRRFREEEHQQILNAHVDVYRKALMKNNGKL